MSASVWKGVARLAAVVGGVLVLAIVACAVFRKDCVVSPGTPARFDDTAFAVVDVRRMDEIGGVKPARDTYLVVRFGVWNQARRVDFSFHAERAEIEDASGRSYPLDQDATRSLARTGSGLAPCDRPIPAGSSCTTDLVFVVPIDVAAPSLRMRSDPIAEFLDWIIEGHVRFSIEPPPPRPE